MIWKHSGSFRLGWIVLPAIFLVLLSFYKFSWTSSWSVVLGDKQVQEFSLHSSEFGAGPFVSWTDTPPRLLLEPYPSYVLPRSNQVLSIDLETRQARWLPKATINLDDATSIKYLDEANHGKFDERGVRSLNYALSSKLGTMVEFSFVGFSLPRLVYRIPWFFSEASGWGWEKNYFGWVGLVVRESKSSPIVVELKQTLFNSPSEDLPSLDPLTVWLLGGKFLAVNPYQHIDPRVLVLGPFNISQNTHFTNHNSKE